MNKDEALLLVFFGITNITNCLLDLYYELKIWIIQSGGNNG